MNNLSLSNIPELGPRKQEILDAACRLFSQKGYLAASMRDLAQELNIKPPSLYSHYTSKDEMLWEIARRCAKDFYELVLPIASQGGSISSRLGLMIRKHAEAIVRNQDAAAIFFREWTHLEEPNRTRYQEIIHNYESAFARLIREGMQIGEFRQVSVRFTNSTLLSSISWIHQWYKPEGSMDLQAIGDQLEDFLLAGLKKDPS